MADRADLTTLTKQQSAIRQWTNTAIANGQVLKELAKKVDQTGYPAIEGWIRAGRQSSGDPVVAQFNAQMELYRAEAAKVITNPNLSGQLTDHARDEVRAFLGGGASAKQIIAVVDLLEQDFGRRDKALADEIQVVRNRLQGKKGSTEGGGGAGGGETPPVPNARKAPDGNWYIDDPNRPGKYLKVG
jgi:hypothetical protein